jgi:hypothetical protein
MKGIACPTCFAIMPKVSGAIANSPLDWPSDFLDGRSRFRSSAP